RYPLYIFRISVPDRLRALRRSAFDQSIRVGRDYACVGTTRQADAGDLAFLDVTARLLAAGKMAKCETQSAKGRTGKAHPRKDSVVRFRGRVSRYDFDSAIAWRGCAHTRP